MRPVRLALFPLLRKRSEAVIQSKAQENSTFIETARAIQSLKLFNRETSARVNGSIATPMS
jgi:ATP-binding cassette subfamily B protein RaxB